MTCSERIALHQTDAAGVWFSGAAITAAHAAYEATLAGAGYDIATTIRANAIALPVRRCMAEFNAPVRHGDVVHWHVSVAEVRDHGYRVQIVARDSNDHPALSVELVIACIGTDGRHLVDLPADLRQALDALLEQ
ncbi:MAG: acyl-CoA thioesterase [Planctomycetota bacterium]